MVRAAGDADDRSQFPVRLAVHRLALIENATRVPGRMPAASAAMTLRLLGTFLPYQLACSLL
jgi:hypothetical protein